MALVREASFSFSLVLCLFINFMSIEREHEAERVREKEREIFCLLIHSLKGLTRPKSEPRTQSRPFLVFFKIYPFLLEPHL